jgi:hypothetical protein
MKLVKGDEKGRDDRDEKTRDEVTFTLPDDAFPPPSTQHPAPSTHNPGFPWLLLLLFGVCSAGWLLVGILIGRGLWS